MLFLNFAHLLRNFDIEPNLIGQKEAYDLIQVILVELSSICLYPFHQALE